MNRLFLTPLNIVLAALVLLVAIAGFVVIPAGQILPIHWGLDGQADDWAPREIALLIGPALALSVGLLMAAIRRWGAKGRAESGFHVLRAAFTAILLLALGISAAIVLIGAGNPVSMVQIVCFCLAALVLIIGNAMPKSQPNSFAGIRIRPALEDPANWQATHRLVGALMIASAPVIALAGFLMQPSIWLFAILIAAMLLPGIIGTVYSYNLARRTAAAAR
jgi:uncharacterized membrane protein